MQNTGPTNSQTETSELLLGNSKQLFPLEKTHRIHGTGIFIYIWLKFMANVGKYTSDMDPMGNIPW